MNDIFSLSDLQVGERATVEKLLSEGTIRRRLLDIGLIEGTDVECVLKSPYGDPTAYQIRGSVIALRSEDSDAILVSSRSEKHAKSIDPGISEAIKGAVVSWD